MVLAVLAAGLVLVVLVVTPAEIEVVPIVELVEWVVMALVPTQELRVI